jgi:hypothetical protein
MRKGAEKSIIKGTWAGEGRVRDQLDSSLEGIVTAAVLKGTPIFAPGKRASGNLCATAPKGAKLCITSPAELGPARGDGSAATRVSSLTFPALQTPPDDPLT